MISTTCRMFFRGHRISGLRSVRQAVHGSAVPLLGGQAQPASCGDFMLSTDFRGDFDCALMMISWDLKVMNKDFMVINGESMLV